MPPFQRKVLFTLECKSYIHLMPVGLLFRSESCIYLSIPFFSSRARARHVSARPFRILQSPSHCAAEVHRRLGLFKRQFAARVLICSWQKKWGTVKREKREHSRGTREGEESVGLPRRCGLLQVVFPLLWFSRPYLPWDRHDVGLFCPFLARAPPPPPPHPWQTKKGVKRKRPP